MNYEQIKSKLNEAGRLVDAGQVAEADTMIRSMRGEGVTANDISTNLTSAQMRQLRIHSKK